MNALQHMLYVAFFLTGKIKNKIDYEHEGATSYTTGSIRLAYSRFDARNIIHIVFRRNKAFLGSREAKHLRSEVYPLDDHGPNPTSCALKALSLYALRQN